MSDRTAAATISRVFVIVALGVVGIGLWSLVSVYAAVPPQSGPSAAASTNGSRYAGDAACLPCHQAQATPYSRTAHHLTSQQADEKTVLGSFAEPQNLLLISVGSSEAEEPKLYFKMESKPEGLYQTAVAELGAKRLMSSARFDITVGAGVRGQTYLYWKDDELFELPVSYWTDGRQWINSPGYMDGTANFKRHVDPRCMECHTTFIHALSDDPQTNTYDSSSLVTGIACETCHGPGAVHVALEQEAATKHVPVQSAAILNPAKFIRDRQIDGCALCHNGIAREELQPAFSYVPGRVLDEYLAPNPMDVVDKPDVHGNQVGLLKRSRCYRASPDMTCSTCHEVHAPGRTPAAYSDRCLSCHRWQSCGASRVLGERVKQDCIRCHMPLQNTAAIVSVTAGREVRARIRTHWIKVYPEFAPTVP